MAAFRRRSVGTVAGIAAPEPSLDYYLIRPPAGGATATIAEAATGGGAVDGLLVEEFVLADDYSAVGLNSTGWTPAEGRWWSSAAFSRDVRADRRLRARLVAASRDEARLAYRRLGGGELPDEAALRGHFRDYQSLTASAPLRLGPDRAPDGYADKRVYRVLFANDLDPDQLADLQAIWQLVPAGERAGSWVVGTARLPVADNLFTWDVRRIGAGVAWCLDLTACLGGGPGRRSDNGPGSGSDNGPGGGAGGDDHPAIGALLRELTEVMRHHGLIPVTIERFC
jgi:hypothetical protein